MTSSDTTQTLQVKRHCELSKNHSVRKNNHTINPENAK